MNLKRIVLSERRLMRKAAQVWRHWDDILEMAKPQGQKGAHWLPEAGGGEGG